MRRADAEDKAKLAENRMHWLGQVCRMDDDRPVNILLNSESFHGSRPLNRPILRFKDACKMPLKCIDVQDLWKKTVEAIDKNGEY